MFLPESISTLTHFFSTKENFCRCNRLILAPNSVVLGNRGEKWGVVSPFVTHDGLSELPFGAMAIDKTWQDLKDRLNIQLTQRGA